MFETYTFPSVIEGNNTDLKNVSIEFKVFHDNDFTISHKIFLGRGGALYSQLVDCFKEEFQDVFDLEVAQNPQSLASDGCCINSAQLNGVVKGNAVSLDIGNATTIVTVCEEDNLANESSIPAEY